MPKSIFNNGKTPFGLVLGGWFVMRNLIRMPDFSNESFKFSSVVRRERLVAVYLAQLISYSIVFLNECSSGNFSRVRS